VTGVENTLAYYGTEVIKALRSYIVQVSGIIKIFGWNKLACLAKSFLTYISE
jgi:hypothetical protein